MVDLSGEMQLTALEEGQTRLDWKATVTVSGTIASVGARLLQKTTEKLTEQFFPLNGNLILRYAHFGGKKETISSSLQVKIAIQQKGGLHPALNELHRLLTRALKKTEERWPALSQAYGLVHQAAHVLANHENESGQAVRERYESVLCAMREQQASLGALGEAISTFLKVTESYWPGLFHCYDVADLPRTNNELEHCFGSVRYSERRASGRRGAIAALVVRGPVRVLTALALRHQCFLPRALVLDDLEAWYTMREQLTFRREARRKQLRFRKDPAAYLAALEDILLKIGLPS